MHYDLTHLTQSPEQNVIGPVQDDEALLLFSLVRCCRIKRIVEVGAGDGYSARNFLRAAGWAPDAIVYSIDSEPVTELGENHVVIQKCASKVEAGDLSMCPVELIFFDCHDFDAQMTLFHRLRADGVILDSTLIVLHDTNLHPGRIGHGDYMIEGGWVHQKCERRMVNALHAMGYDCLPLTTKIDSHGPQLPFRHGLTICRRFSELVV